MASLGYLVSMIALSPASTMFAPSLCSVSLVSSPLTKRRTLRASASPSMETTPYIDVSIVSASKKVLVPIGYGTEEIEAVVLVDVLRRAGAEVTLASVEQKLEVEGSSGTKLLLMS